MALTEAGKKSIKKYLGTLDEIKVRVPKGEKAIWFDHAATQGESLNAFIRRSVAETIERDNKEKK